MAGCPLGSASVAQRGVGGKAFLAGGFPASKPLLCPIASADGGRENRVTATATGHLLSVGHLQRDSSKNIHPAQVVGRAKRFARTGEASLEAESLPGLRFPGSPQRGYLTVESVEFFVRQSPECGAQRIESVVPSCPVFAWKERPGSHIAKMPSPPSKPRALRMKSSFPGA